VGGGVGERCRERGDEEELEKKGRRGRRVEGKEKGGKEKKKVFGWRGRATSVGGDLEVRRRMGRGAVGGKR